MCVIQKIINGRIRYKDLNVTKWSCIQTPQDWLWLSEHYVQICCCPHLTAPLGCTKALRISRLNILTKLWLPRQSACEREGTVWKKQQGHKYFHDKHCKFVLCNHNCDSNQTSEDYWFSTLIYLWGLNVFEVWGNVTATENVHSSGVFFFGGNLCVVLRKSSEHQRNPSEPRQSFITHRKTKTHTKLSEETWSPLSQWCLFWRLSYTVIINCVWNQMIIKCKAAISTQLFHVQG